MKRRAITAALLAALGWWAILSTPASAHPHVFVSARAEIVFGPDGAVTALKHIWSFDEAYSAYITQGLDKNGDGKLTPDELVDLAKVNMESLPEVGFFTTAKANGKAQEFGEPTEASLSFENKILTLTYTLPLKTPVKSVRSLGLEIGDPTYFVAFDIVDAPDAVITRDAPKGCVVRVARPPKLDAATQLKLAQEDITATPDMSGFEVTTRALVACP
ncbi:ABC-type uncharacterized transport system, substrate-binding protein [Bosea sp. OK403]|uniref:DUF1007 family protein n=1 Tax=Bosea sp. OK403 TaxID=1855286 RepID=UPI0008ED15B8|nr:DUF1007 family protein [Bosea sp. OK403]SFJ45523.1 ABC-type uncharacterized transport system, substrate-binding protein [Bosea sp. OK403]